MAATIQPGPAGAVSDRGVLALARLLRVLSGALTGGLALIVAGSVLAFGAVHPWAEAPLFGATGILVLVALARAATVVQLRRRIGRSQFAFHSSGRWIVLDVEEPYGIKTWSFDLDRPLVPSVPLLLPGLLFAGWVVVQLVPLPPALADALAGVETLPGGDPDTRWRPVSVSPAQSVDGLAFLVWALILHVVASSALAAHQSERRFRRFVAILGVALAAIGLAQMATGTRRLYWFFSPWEGSGASIFGPFVSRDHYAFYMLMVTSIAFGLFARAYRHYRMRTGTRPNFRRRMVTLSSPEGLTMIYASIPALAAVGALIATTCRGAIIAFAGALLLVAIAARRRGGVPSWAFAVVFTIAVLSWFGTERIEARMRRFGAAAPGRTLVWQGTLERMGGRWIGGSGYNTFGTAVFRSSAWTLPTGSTPWSEREETIVEVPRAGYLLPDGLPGVWWYREAHNDYVQVLAETGVVGLALALWAAGRLLVAVRSDKWLLAAMAAVLMHTFVDFGFHVPAIVALFVTLAAIKPYPTPR